MRFRSPVSSRFLRASTRDARPARAMPGCLPVNLRDAIRGARACMRRAARRTHRVRDAARTRAIAPTRVASAPLRGTRSDSTASKKTVDSQARRV